MNICLLFLQKTNQFDNFFNLLIEVSWQLFYHDLLQLLHPLQVWKSKMLGAKKSCKILEIVYNTV